MNEWIYLKRQRKNKKLENTYAHISCINCMIKVYILLASPFWKNGRDVSALLYLNHIEIGSNFRLLSVDNPFCFRFGLFLIFRFSIILRISGNLHLKIWKFLHICDKPDFSCKSIGWYYNSFGIQSVICGIFFCRRGSFARFTFGFWLGFVCCCCCCCYRHL